MDEEGNWGFASLLDHPVFRAWRSDSDLLSLGYFDYHGEEAGADVVVAELLLGFEAKGECNEFVRRKGVPLEDLLGFDKEERGGWVCSEDLGELPLHILVKGVFRAIATRFEHVLVLFVFGKEGAHGAGVHLNVFFCQGWDYLLGLRPGRGCGWSDDINMHGLQSPFGGARAGGAGLCLLEGHGRQ